MTPKQATKQRLRTQRAERAALAPSTTEQRKDSDDGGPATVANVHEGASTGRSSASPAGGAAGQLVPKDER